MSGTTSILEQTYSPNGSVAVDELVGYLHITKTELAAAAGLPRDAVSKKTRLHSVRTQRRLGEVVEIINRVMPWSGSVQAAFAWYRAQPLPSFGGLTAEDLVKAGRGEAVRNYLSRVAVGGYT
jgi:hypothetical protein